MPPLLPTLLNFHNIFSFPPIKKKFPFSMVRIRPSTGFLPAAGRAGGTLPQKDAVSQSQSLDKVIISPSASEKLFMLLRTKPLPLSRKKHINNPFGKEPVVGKLASPRSEWESLIKEALKMGKGRLPGKLPKYPSYIRDGGEAVYKSESGALIIFMMLHARGTWLAERSLVLQELLIHYKIPHLPLWNSRKALFLARHGILMQEEIPARADPLFHKVWSDNASPSSIDFDAVEKHHGRHAREELMAFMEKIDKIENNKILKEEARRRGYTNFPAGRLLDLQGGRHFPGDELRHTAHLFYRHDETTGRRWFLVSW
jgi:hypothetical protein